MTKKWVYRLSGIFILIFFWQILASFYPSSILPGVIEILIEFSSIITENEFIKNLFHSFMRVFTGTMIALIIGMIIGILGGIFMRVKESFYPIMVFMESIPPMAWMVLAILWFQIGHIPPVIAAIASATPLVFLNIIEGVQSIDKQLLEMSQYYSLSFKEMVKNIYIPSLIPSILAALSASLSLNWRVVVMAEALSSFSGLGQLLWSTYQYGSTAAIYAYVLIIAIMGFFMEFLLIEPLKNFFLRKFRLGQVK
ncbi:MAG: ABC transporter permease [Minisyncoccales bacterium]